MVVAVGGQHCSLHSDPSSWDKQAARVRKKIFSVSRSQRTVRRQPDAAPFAASLAWGLVCAWSCLFWVWFVYTSYSLSGDLTSFRPRNTEDIALPPSPCPRRNRPKARSWQPVQHPLSFSKPQRRIAILASRSRQCMQLLHGDTRIGPPGTLRSPCQRSSSMKQSITQSITICLHDPYTIHTRPIPHVPSPAHAGFLIPERPARRISIHSTSLPSRAPATL
jgi:hypothetical protein